MTLSEPDKPSILIVDQDYAASFTFQMALSSHGYRAATLQAPQNLMDQLAKHPFDGIIFDPNLYDQDGTEMLRLVRQRHPRLPILIISIAPITILSDDPFVDYLAKPPSLDSIRKAVGDLINAATCGS